MVRRAFLLCILFGLAACADRALEPGAQPTVGPGSLDGGVRSDQGLNELDLSRPEDGSIAPGGVDLAQPVAEKGVPCGAQTCQLGQLCCPGSGTALGVRRWSDDALVSDGRRRAALRWPRGLRQQSAVRRCRIRGLRAEGNPLPQEPRPERGGDLSRRRRLPGGDLLRRHHAELCPARRRCASAGARPASPRPSPAASASSRRP